MTAPALPRDYQWNFRIWVTETATWMLATAFLDSTTVLPALLQMLTGSSLLAGAILSLRYAGQGWPQLIAASLVSGKPKRKPFFFRAVIPGRLLLIWPAVMLGWAHAGTAWIVAAVLIGDAAFWVSEGFSIVPWVDMLGKTIPPQRRGRLFATMIVGGGLLGVLGGLLTDRILQSPAWPFPRGYGMLFALACATLVVSTAALAWLREPPSPAHEERYATRALIKDIPNLLRTMPQFRQLVIVQALFAFALLPAPLYILLAEHLLRPWRSGALVGLFLAVQVAGLVIGNSALGQLGDKHGNRLLLRVLGIAHSLVPACAALAILLAPRLPGWALFPFFALTFFGYGAFSGSTWMGITNFLLEIAPEHDRPAFIAVLNALNIPAVVLPLLGGILLSRLGYLPLFGVTIAALLYGAWHTGALREPRHVALPYPPREASGGAEE